jgi:predicted GNAT family N-acyltransferase
MWIDSKHPWFPEALALRRDVFVDEQGVPADLEVDDQDTEAKHLVALAKLGTSELIVGTLRLLAGEACGGVGRVAVRADFRQRGIGRLLLIEALEECERQRYSTVALTAQLASVGFYRALGFEVTSGTFQDAGIAHVRMQRRVLAAGPPGQRD